MIVPFVIAAARATTEEHDASKSARLALSLPSQALLDHAAAQVSVDQSTFGPIGGFAKLLVGDSFTAREAGKRLGLENAHP